jgi:hypothetical protein
MGVCRRAGYPAVEKRSLLIFCAVIAAAAGSDDLISADNRYSEGGEEYPCSQRLEVR